MLLSMFNLVIIKLILNPSCKLLKLPTVRARHPQLIDPKGDYLPNGVRDVTTINNTTLIVLCSYHCIFYRVGLVKNTIKKYKLSLIISHAFHILTNIIFI